MPWYVVHPLVGCENEAWAAGAFDPTKRNWTVSRDPNEAGWTTDDGVDGYGLSKKDAQFLADAANEKETR
jgi:hypothetical protein